jgi:hypothetical protein
MTVGGNSRWSQRRKGRGVTALARHDWQGTLSVIAYYSQIGCQVLCTCKVSIQVIISPLLSNHSRV